MVMGLQRLEWRVHLHFVLWAPTSANMLEQTVRYFTALQFSVLALWFSNEFLSISIVCGTMLLSIVPAPL